jgi:hypothetical protein
MALQLQPGSTRTSDNAVQYQRKQCEVCKDHVNPEHMVTAEIIGRERQVCKPCRKHLRDAY